MAEIHSPEINGVPTRLEVREYFANAKMVGERNFDHSWPRFHYDDGGITGGWWVKAEGNWTILWNKDEGYCKITLFKESIQEQPILPNVIDSSELKAKYISIPPMSIKQTSTSIEHIPILNIKRR